MEITVLEARDLDKEDWLGKSDPLVEVWTQHTHIEATVSSSLVSHPLLSDILSNLQSGSWKLFSQ